MGTYTLIPSPFTGHKITVDARTVGSREVTERGFVKVVGEIWIAELDMDECAGITGPNLIFLVHPRGNMARGWSRPIVLDRETHPRCVTGLDGVDDLIQFLVIGVWRGFGGIAVGRKKQQASNELKKLIDFPL